MLTPESSPVEVVRCAEGSVQDFETDILRLKREEFKGVHYELGVRAGQHPGNCIGFLHFGLGVDEVINFLHKQQNIFNYIFTTKRVNTDSINLITIDYITFTPL